VTSLRFSVPYNQDLETLRALLERREIGDTCISEVYLSGPNRYSGSGRIVEALTTEQMAFVLDEIHRHGVTANLLMNSTCEGADWYSPSSWSAMMDFVQHMHLCHGLDAVTVANPLLAREFRRAFPKLGICASVLADIDCLERAILFVHAGADTITPEVSINRDLALLTAIKKRTGVRLKLMVNEGCLYKCAFRKFHFNYISHRSKELPETEEDPFMRSCTRILAEDLTQILKSGWIRPEDTRKYHELSDFFKVVGRTRPRTHVLRSVHAYMEESWQGDLLDILDSSLNKFGLEYGATLPNQGLGEAGFFEHVTSCGHDNSDCEYCRLLATRLIRIGLGTREKLEDLGLAVEGVTFARETM
jgi:collagenase-like PrtC family protease